MADFMIWMNGKLVPQTEAVLPVNSAAVFYASNVFEGFRTVRIYNLLARGKIYESIPVHENVLPIVERVLDRGCLCRLRCAAVALGRGAAARNLRTIGRLLDPRARALDDGGVGCRGQSYRRALRAVHHHRARGINPRDRCQVRQP